MITAVRGTGLSCYAKWKGESRCECTADCMRPQGPSALFFSDRFVKLAFSFFIFRYRIPLQSLCTGEGCLLGHGTIRIACEGPSMLLLARRYTAKWSRKGLISLRKVSFQHSWA